MKATGNAGNRGPCGGAAGGRAPKGPTKSNGEAAAPSRATENTTCGRCAAPLGPAELVLCGARCEKLWVIAYSYMTEEDFADKYKADVDFKNSTDLAERVLDRNVDRGFYPSSIQRDDSVQMAAVGKFRGYTSSDFKEDFGMALSEADYKVREIPSPDGSTYKGVLINVGDSKNRDVELRVVKGFSHQEHLLQVDNCVHPQQGELSFDH
eukprot:7017599-Pyramimonas_sp.AAC.1